MGMYTKLKIDIEIKYYAPEYIKLWLKHLSHCKGDDKLPRIEEDHPFLHCYRNSMLLYNCLPKDIDIYKGKNLDLKIDIEIKNYKDEIEQFLHWIKPYVYGCDNFVGWYQCEESEDPTLIYIDYDGEFFYKNAGSKVTKITYDFLEQQKDKDNGQTN